MRFFNLLPLFAGLQGVLAEPAQPDISNTTTLPTHFGMMVFPHFQALDVFGPMDILNSLFMMYHNTTMPKFSVLSRTMEPVTTAMMKGGFGQEIMPTITFADYLAQDTHQNNDNVYKMPITNDATATADIEVLIVPGGGGTRRDMTAEIAFVETMYPKLKYIISICTGASILSRAGILNGRNATTNKRAWAWVTSTGPNVTWVPTARWVEDGNIWSSSGISAGIDATYAWVSRVYGDEVAEYMSLSLEYERQVDEHHDPFGKVWDVPGAT
ncbi:class I glutamine amidotransferase-like protein [Decorospora gaudefroyi]|uniref:Class I glutamine amidotransferase-like protein n=1 Tax=Decorospora gaudefroyi TaxID=184978 RepID=A0A6A5K985_9PLEO|nr:class I glutamine amidotransferase-like protein [Decorospora gaudefroyi]